MLGVVSIGLYLVDWNQYRETLAELASERLGMRVELAGDLNLGLLPRPTVTAQAVRLSPLQTDFNDTIATADRIDMHLGFAALISGSMELQSLALEGVSAGLVETVDGWTIEGWPTNSGAAEDEADSTLLSLDRFRIKSGSISVRPLDSKEVIFDGVDVSLAGQLPGGPLDLTGTAIIDGSAVSLTGKIVPTRTLGSTSVRFDVEAAESKLEFSGRLSNDGQVTGRFQATGQSLLGFAAFMNKTLGTEGSLRRMPALPYKIDVQIERSTGDITRLVSRQFKIGDTQGNIDLTLAEQGDIFHVTGTGSFGIIALDRWLNAVPDQLPEGLDGQQKPLPIAGNIDMSIEGVEFQGGLAQQVQTSISFSDGQIILDQLRATLPGASRFAYIAETPNIGTVQFQSGAVQEVFKWAGLPISDSIPAGRLSTADLQGRLTVLDETWVLSDLSGTIDTTGVEAEVSGANNSFVPNAAKIKLDQLNLDAYWPNPQFGGASSDGFGPSMQFDFEVDQLRWLQQSFEKVSIAGQLGKNHTSISNFSVEHQGGNLSGNLSIQKPPGAPEDVEITASLADWQAETLAQFSPEISAFLSRFSDGNAINGAVSATGPMTNLQSRIRMTSGESTLEFAGTVDASENQRVQLQGSVKHANIESMFEQEGFIGRGSLRDVKADLQVSLEGTKEIFSFGANGVVADGQSNFSGTYDNGRIDADISVTVLAGVEGGLDALSRYYGVKLDPTHTRRLRLKWAKDKNGWRITDLDARNGDAVIAGDISNADSVVSGAMSVSSMDISTLFSDSGASDETSLPNGGTISIQATDVTWMGQIFTMPAATFTFSLSGGMFDVGKSALLNGGLLQTKLEYDQQADAISANITAASLNVGTFLKNMGGTRGFTGTVSTNVSLQASLAKEDSFLETLTGEGRFEGGAGAMHFLAAKELISVISSSESSVAFLQSVSNLLRVGTTDFADFTGSFRMDNGVALVDEIVASGEWGNLALDGQVNIPGDYVNMTGQLSLSQPLDTPTIPVVYEGSLTAPNVRWTSRALEKFAIAGIERRLRTRIYGELERAGSEQPDGVQQSPGATVFGVANSLLEKLRARQNEAKRLETEKRAAEIESTEKPSSLDSEGQRPV